jgi:hypothetical protein
MRRLLSPLRKGATLLAMLLLVFAISSVSAQRPQPRCQILTTRYPLLTSDWNWISENRVEFTVSTEPTSDSGIFPKVDAHYQYDTVSGVLTLLEAPTTEAQRLGVSDRQSVSAAARNADGTFVSLSVSPAASEAVYITNQQNQSEVTYLDTTTGRTVELPLTSLGILKPEIFWSQSPGQFLVGLSGSNFSYPVQVVNVVNSQITVERLGAMPGLANWTTMVDFMTLGFSPDARYVVMQPMTVEYLVWLYDIQTNTLSTLPFSAASADRVSWINSREFIIQVDRGVIRYSINSGNYTLLATTQEVEGFVGSLSPNGQYLIGYKPGPDGNWTESVIASCRIY